MTVHRNYENFSNKIINYMFNFTLYLSVRDSDERKISVYKYEVYTQVCVCAFYVYEFFPSYPNIVAILTKKAEYLDLALILARGFFTRPEKGF